MNTIEDYISQTKSAVKKLYEAHDSYYELLRTPKRPGFTCWGDPDSEVNKKAYDKWRRGNEKAIHARIEKDDEFVFEFFARSTLLSSILQFGFWGIEKFSKNVIVAKGFEDIIESNSKQLKFCIGRQYENIPIGLIVYAGRNQAIHFDDKEYNRVTTRVFDLLSNWYSPTFKKLYKNDSFDLKNPNVINFAENIIHILHWQTYEIYERDLLEMLKSGADK